MAFQLDSNIPLQRKSISDYMRQAQQDEAAQEERRINNDFQRQYLDIAKQKSLHERMKADEIDADKLGEKAFLKAAQGMPLSAQEEAALQYIDAKSPTHTFNPVTGVMEQKPSLLDRAGLNRRLTDKIQPGSTLATPAIVPPRATQPTAPTSLSPEKSEWDIEYENQLRQASGNPRLQQTIRENYAKDKLKMDEAETKNAAYADRMMNSDPIIDKTSAASTDKLQNAIGSTPLVGNWFTSDDYKSATQAQRDFLNSILRRESGAVISPSEFEEGRKQYFPIPGDGPDIIAQKKANREAATRGVARSAGPAYKRPTLNTKIQKNVMPKTTGATPTSDPYAKAQAAIAAGADRQKVMQRLQEAGYDPAGLGQ